MKMCGGKSAMFFTNPQHFVQNLADLSHNQPKIFLDPKFLMLVILYYQKGYIAIVLLLQIFDSKRVCFWLDYIIPFHVNDKKYPDLLPEQNFDN